MGVEHKQLCLRTTDLRTLMANIFSWAADSLTPPTDYELSTTAQADCSIDTSDYVEGTGSMKYVATQGQPGDVGIKNLNGSAWPVNFGDRHYHRFWMKMQQSGWSWSNANKTKAGRTQVPGEGGSRLTMYLGAGGIWPGEHGDYGFTSAQGAGSGGEGPYNIEYDFDPTTNADVRNWQEYIVEFQWHSSASATDGHLKLYVNGVKVGELTGIRWWSDNPTPNSVVEAWAPFMAMHYPQDIDAGSTMWVDAFSVDTTWNSTTYPEPGGGGGASVTKSGKGVSLSYFR